MYSSLCLSSLSTPSPSYALSLSFSPSSLALVKKLIYEIDLKLYNFFDSSECRDYLFCHR